MSGALLPDLPPARIRRVLGRIGQGTRRRASFILMLHALMLGVIRSALWPVAWRRSVRAEFHRALAFSIGGGLTTVVMTAALAGIGLVSQALYWLGTAGEDALIGPTLVTVLVRELTPILIGLLILGRSGAAVLHEIGRMRLAGQWRVLEAQGVDPFQFLVVPRAVALALSSFALGVVFVLVALVTGFVSSSLLGQFNHSFLHFIDDVLAAMRVRDFLVFPAKMLLIGMMVALVACLTAFRANDTDQLAELQSRGFLRGLLAVLLVSLTLSFAG